MKYYKPLLFLLSLLLVGCGNRATDETELTRFQRDSLATVDKALKLRWERKYTECKSILDSVFTISWGGEGELTHFEARRLTSQAIKQLMFLYNSNKESDQGLAHFDSLLAAPNTLVSEECRRELLVGKAQLLMSKSDHTESCRMLDSALMLPKNDDPQSELFTTITAGVTYRWVDSTSTKAEPTLERAMEAMRLAGYDGTMLFPQAMANLAAIYMKKAQYKKSIDLCHEVIDICDRNYYIRGAIIASYNLSEMYGLLGNKEEAMRYNTLGLRYLRRDSTAYGLGGDLYRIRANLMRETHPRDSVLEALREADRKYTLKKDQSARLSIEMERLNTWVDVSDSLPAIVEAFPRLKNDVPGHEQLFWHTSYGNALMAAGNKREAIPVWESALVLARKEEGKKKEHDICRYLMECYLQEGKIKEARALYPKYQAISEEVAAETKIRELALANIHYETEKKEQRNELLATELAFSKSKNRLYLFSGIALLLTLLTLSGWLLSRQRGLRLENELAGREAEMSAKEAEIARERLSEKEKQLRRLITNRKELSDRNEELLRELARIQKESNNGCQLDTVMQSLLPSLLTPVEEDLFRRQFAELYPSAIINLRRAQPHITRQEELFAMLTLLNLNNKEIAQTLGINKDSVTKMRYRLRIKFILPQGEDIEEYLRRIMVNE